MRISETGNLIFGTSGTKLNIDDVEIYPVTDGTSV